MQTDGTYSIIGNGVHKAHFDNIEYSRFANIDPAHANVVMDDETLIATGRLIFSIGKGFVSGLQEALATEGLNATALAFTTAVGIAITAGMAVLPATVAAVIGTLMALLSVISASFMAAQAVEGIYNTSTGTGTSYQKAEAYAHDAALRMSWDIRQRQRRLRRFTVLMTLWTACRIVWMRIRCGM